MLVNKANALFLLSFSESFFIFLSLLSGFSSGGSLMKSASGSTCKSSLFY
jgi:hypothetical protein